MELRFDEVFGEMNIEQLFEKIVKIIFGQFVKEVIGSALKAILPLKFPIKPNSNVVREVKSKATFWFWLNPLDWKIPQLVRSQPSADISK